MEEKIKHFENKFSEGKTLETKLNDAENHLQKQAKQIKQCSKISANYNQLWKKTRRNYLDVTNLTSHPSQSRV